LYKDPESGAASTHLPRDDTPLAEHETEDQDHPPFLAQTSDSFDGFDGSFSFSGDVSSQSPLPSQAPLQSPSPSPSATRPANSSSDSSDDTQQPTEEGGAEGRRRMYDGGGRSLSMSISTDTSDLFPDSPEPMEVINIITIITIIIIINIILSLLL
jgi:hypothetical protein